MAKENSGRRNGCWNAVYFNQRRRSQKRYLEGYANGVLRIRGKTDTIVKEINCCDEQLNTGKQQWNCAIDGGGVCL